MIESYCLTVIKYWVDHWEKYKSDPEGADERFRKFRHKLQGFLPVTDLLYINSVDELRLKKEDDGGFVIVTMLQDHEGDFPFVGQIGRYYMLTADYHERMGWTAVYAYEPPPEDDDV
jgi:hypothetical protein